MSESQVFEVPSDRNASGRSFGSEELGYLREVLESGALNSNGGAFVRRFEEAFAAKLGARFCIACSSGSLAVQAALVARSAERGSEVVTSPITDFGAITALLYEGLRPRFCDVDAETLMPTRSTIERALDTAEPGQISAVVVTHLFGRTTDIEAIAELCRARGIACIEDAAQTLGSVRAGRRPGTFGDLGAFSFQQSKQICAGEGGAIVTDDEEHAKRARLFVNKAWPYGDANPDHRFVAPNGRLTELQAAVLLAQLEKLDGFVEARVASADAFAQALGAELGTDPEAAVRLRAVPAGDIESPWRLHLRTAPTLDLERFVEEVRARGLPCAAHYVGRAAFELQAMRDAGFDERVENFPGVVDGLAHCVVVPWNERIGVELGAELGAMVGRSAKASLR